MTLKRPLIIISRFVIASLLIACQDTDVKPTVGNILGYVYKADEFGNFQKDHSGIIIDLSEGQNHFSSKTSATGKYEFQNIPQGTYDLIFSGSGLAATALFSLPHIGGANPTYAGIRHIAPYSTTTIFDFDVTEYGAIQGSISTSNEGVSKYRGVDVFLDVEKTVSSRNYLVRKSITNGTIFSQWWGDIYDDLFTKGDTIYIKAYGFSYGGNVLEDYYDPYTGGNIYPYYNQTPTETLIYVSDK